MKEVLRCLSGENRALESKRRHEDIKHRLAHLALYSSDSALNALLPLNRIINSVLITCLGRSVKSEAHITTATRISSEYLCHTSALLVLFSCDALYGLKGSV